MTARRHARPGIAFALLALALACNGASRAGEPEPTEDESVEQQVNDDEAADDRAFERADERARMVASQIAARGVTDERVLAAVRRVPRHRFVPESLRDEAYDDTPLPLSHGQTISQPYVVASMTEVVGIEPHERVLEIGTGSGYQAAILGELAAEVYTIEIVPELAASAAATLEELGYENVHVQEGDGYRGWPEHAPFDAIVVTAAPDHVPPALKDQLAVGGRLVIPVGTWAQDLLMIERTEDGFERRTLYGVRFVPMTGEARDR